MPGGEFKLNPRAAYFAELSRERRAERARLAEEERRRNSQPIRYRALLGDAGKFASAPHAIVLGDETLLALQRERCFLCTGRMRDGFTRDHVWPKSQGGTFVGNKLLSHRQCNQHKGDRRPTGCELLYRDGLYEIAATPKRVRLHASS